MYRIIHLFPHLKKIIFEIVPLWLKNRNQCVDTGGGGGGLCVEGPTRGGGAYRRRNAVAKSIPLKTK